MDQFWADGNKVNYSPVPNKLIKTPQDFLFWDWYDGEIKAGRIPSGSVNELKKSWHNNIYLYAIPGDNVNDDLTISIVQMLRNLYNSRPVMIKKSLTFSGRKLQKRSKFQGMDISIENRKGSYRSGKDPDSKQWKTKMHFDYGCIRGTVGVDKDHVDVFIGNDKKSQKVFIIHQKHVKSGKYDEDKVMLGWTSKKQVIADYLLNYNREDMFMGITTMTMKDFKKKAFNKKNRGKMIKSIGVPLLIRSKINVNLNN